MYVNTETLDQLWKLWRAAAAEGRAVEAREYREMYLGLLANVGNASHIGRGQEKA